MDSYMYMLIQKNEYSVYRTDSSLDVCLNANTSLIEGYSVTREKQYPPICMPPTFRENKSLYTSIITDSTKISLKALNIPRNNNSRERKSILSNNSAAAAGRLIFFDVPSMLPRPSLARGEVCGSVNFSRQLV